VKKSVKVWIVVFVVAIMAACFAPGEIHQILVNMGHYQNEFGTWRGPTGNVMVISQSGVATYQGETATWKHSNSANTDGPITIYIDFPSGTMRFGRYPVN
jgi:hypothetical protein